jgi:hypothetical protein
MTTNPSSILKLSSGDQLGSQYYFGLETSIFESNCG